MLMLSGRQIANASELVVRQIWQNPYAFMQDSDPRVTVTAFACYLGARKTQKIQYSAPFPTMIPAVPGFDGIALSVSSFSLANNYQYYYNYNTS